MKFNIKLVLSLVALGLGASEAYAVDSGTATSTFQVTVQVVPTCTITASDLAFPNYDPGNTTATDTETTTLSTTCTSGTSYQIGLDNGSNGTGPTDRYMEDTNTDKLKYGLYQDATDQTAWGNTTSTEPPSVTGTGAAQMATVYGSIPMGQNVPKGTYKDSITATVTYSA